MATGSDSGAVHCDPCIYSNVTVPAVVWCLSCEDGMCQSCADSHKGIKSTRNHKVVSIDRWHLMSELKHLISQQCEEHNKILDLYCPSHDEACCSLCVSRNHRTCQDLTSLDDVAKNVESSSFFVDLQRDIESLVKNVANGKENRQCNRNRLENEDKSLRTKITELRKDLNKHLDKLENYLLNELSSTHVACESRISESIVVLENINTKAHSMQQNVSELKESVSNVQLFLASRKIQKQLGFENKELETVLTGHLSNDLSLTLDTNPLKAIMDIESYGSVKLLESEPNVHFADQKAKEAQIFRCPIVFGIDTIRLEKRVSIYGLKTGSDIQSGCLICFNGDLMFSAGKHKELQVFSSDGKHIKNISLIHESSDITQISENQIAISFGNSCWFEVAAIDSYYYTKVERIATTNTCWGISYTDEKIALKCTRIHGIEINLYDKTGVFLKQFSDETSSFYNISMFEQRICFSDQKSNFVISLDLNGKTNWKYKFDYLDHPTGITHDRHGNVFVAGIKSKNVVAISPDGRHGKIVLEKENISSLDFDRINEKLLVRAGKEAFLYDVKYI